MSLAHVKTVVKYGIDAHRRDEIHIHRKGLRERSGEAKGQIAGKNESSREHGDDDSNGPTRLSEIGRSITRLYYKSSVAHWPRWAACYSRLVKTKLNNHQITTSMVYRRRSVSIGTPFPVESMRAITPGSDAVTFIAFLSQHSCSWAPRLSLLEAQYTIVHDLLVT